MSNDLEAEFERSLRERILVIDGAMGTMIHRRIKDEAGYRGERFASHTAALKNNTDVLALTQPSVLEDIHRAYLDAGVDIIETNTFNANRVNQGEYGLADYAAEMCLAAARIARRAADEAMARDGSKRRWVAGSIGPTSRTLSVSPDVNDPAKRAVTFDQMLEVYREQAQALIDGGVDVLLPETSFDTLNLKAALMAIEQCFDKLGHRLPVMASFTAIDTTGRNASGQNIAAFLNSVSHMKLATVGINCSLGADQLRAFVEELSGIAPGFTHAYPNAGLPDPLSESGFPETPELFAPKVAEFMANGWVNVVGGCCGTTPEHIHPLVELAKRYGPRSPARPDESYTRLSGLEPYTIRPETNFTVIGERTNLTGSKKFRRLISENNFDAAVTVAREQVDGGANVLDVNVDDGMIDGVAAMTRFLNHIAVEPDIARIPVMVDSSKWEVLEAGLKCLQGKGIVNSISLKEGPEVFLEHARTIKRYGAAVVVMCFDETGQAVTVEHKVSIAERAFEMLTREAGFAPSDVIIDPNILTIGTGIEEHNEYALNFVAATREIKSRCPGVRVSGGLSNISFSFRGNEYVREAMHAAFLHKAIAAGLDMAIVNAGQLAVYDDIAPEVLELVEDVLWNRRPDATERLVTYTQENKREGKSAVVDLAWRNGTLQERVTHALVAGLDAFIEEDMKEALGVMSSALEIIEVLLMNGMSVVGDLFGAGKMFLPQVVKSARVMKKAVAFLDPYMKRGEGSEAKGTVVMATVKGDVHDIGKNIVGVVLGCNSYKVIDLGVMVPAEKILQTARDEKADMIGLSGLITPSLDEMIHVAKEMNRQGMDLPLLIGGATTSSRHTAIKIAPHYRHEVVHVQDASRSVGVVSKLLSAESRAALDAANREEQEVLRQRHAHSRRVPLLSIEEARERAVKLHFDEKTSPVPSFTGVKKIASVDLGLLAEYIDWAPFFHAWEFRGTFPAVLHDERYGTKTRELYEDGRAVLAELIADKSLTANVVYGFFAAQSEGDDLVLYTDDSRESVLERFPMLRQQEARGDGPRRALSDYVAPKGTLADHVGLFAVTAGLGTDVLVKRYQGANDDYKAIIVKAIADRLAEATAEWLHERARREWGFGESPALSKAELVAENYRGVRPAPGYPACPDHTLKARLWRVLQPTERASITLTESFAMSPPASVCGLLFAHPEAKYFAVGRVGRDQVRDLAQRADIPLKEMEHWLSSSLGYDPE